MPVHQLWMLLPVKALCVGELVAYISFLQHKVQKQAPASLNFLHQLPKGLLSFPISSIHAQRHLFFNPLSTRRASSPGFMNLLSILLSFGDISLLGHLRSIGRAIEKSRCLKHIFPRPAPIYFWLANNVIWTAGELCSFHIIGRRTQKLESDDFFSQPNAARRKIRHVARIL